MRSVCVVVVNAGEVLRPNPADLLGQGDAHELPLEVNDYAGLQQHLVSLGLVQHGAQFSTLREMQFGSAALVYVWVPFSQGLPLPSDSLFYVKVQRPSGPSGTLDESFARWKPAYDSFIRQFRDQGGLQLTERGIPARLQGEPCLLLHRLQDRWTRASDAWKHVESVKLSGISGCIPLMGVSGCGKTRTVYEILAANWGFYWTASPQRNGGSQDLSTIAMAMGQDEPFCSRHMGAVIEMKKLILARLLILRYARSLIPDLTPETWLLLQMEFARYSGGLDPYVELSSILVDEYQFQDRDLRELWQTVCVELSCKPIFVVDEAQHLRSVHCFKSPESGQMRGRFSPIMKALLDGRLGTAVCVAGTGISFLQLEDDIMSLVAKTANGLPAFVTNFDKWERAVEVYNFCEEHLKTLGLTAVNCSRLFRKFKGRKRCLVTCLELLLKKGRWSAHIVDDFYAQLTTGNSRDYKMSIYTLVSQFFHSGKGTFRFRGRDLCARELVMRAVSHFFFCERAGLVVDTSEADLVASGIGWCKALRSWGSRAAYEINEPMVLDSMRNYCIDNGHLEGHLLSLMDNLKDYPSSCGNLWERVLVLHLPRFLDGEKPLNSWSCFRDFNLGDPANFKPRIVGDSTAVWRESAVASLSQYLQRPPDKRPMFFMFTSLSGPDVMCFVTWGSLVIPVFLQLKLRYRVQWDQAEGTTNPARMYSRTSKEVTSASRPKLFEACSNGCISLVVAYPASLTKSPRWVGKRLVCYMGKQKVEEMFWVGERLVGYLGKQQVEEMFSTPVCDFLTAIKPDLVDFKRYRQDYSTAALRRKRVKCEEFDVFED